MSEFIQEVVSEAAEILANITAAVRNGELTWQQGVELKQIVLNDTADAAGLQLVRELLYAWQ
jgi:hypothetical protein